MDERPSVADIPERLYQALGPDAFSLVSVWIEDARQARDPEGVRFWSGVAEMLMMAPETPPESAGERTSRPLWWFMQRIEYYRHRAMEAEQKAAGPVTDAVRRDMIDLAIRWRELAVQADLLARGPDPAHAPAARDAKEAAASEADPAVVMEPAESTSGG
jgi:hypothetical protein